MSQIVVGKLLPNLKVTLEKRNDVSENATDEENDFELSNKNVSDSSDNSNLQIVRSWMESLPVRFLNDYCYDENNSQHSLSHLTFLKCFVLSIFF